MSKVCENCGSRISENAKFCRVCGQVQSVQETPVKETAVDDAEVPEAQEATTLENNSPPKEEKTALADDFFVIGSFDDEDDIADYYELDALVQEEEEVIEEDNINRSEQTSAPVKATSKAVRRRRITEDAPEATFSTDMKKTGIFNSDSIDENDGLLADEIAEKKKHEATKIEDEEDGNVDEGRRITNRKRARRQKERTYDESKHYKLKQTKAEDDSDPNYDGYYENIEPIDADEDHRNKINPKTIAIALGLVLLIVGLIAVAVKVLM